MSTPFNVKQTLSNASVKYFGPQISAKVFLRGKSGRLTCMQTNGMVLRANPDKHVAQHVKGQTEVLLGMQKLKIIIMKMMIILTSPL